MEENEEDKNKTQVERTKITNLLGTLKIVFLAERLAGIYRVSFKDGQIIPPNWMKKIYALCLIILHISLYLVFLDLLSVINGGNSVIEVIDEIPVIFILIQYVTTLITTNMLFYKANEEFFTTLADLDGLLITPSSDEFYQKARSRNSRITFSLATVHIVISIADIVTADKFYAGKIIFLPMFLIQKLEILMFCMAIEMLKSRLDLINRYLAKFVNENDGDKISVFTVSESKEVVKETLNLIGRPSENSEKIRDLATMYDTIGSLCSLVNDVFNFQIFMTLVSAFTYIVITIWTSLYYYRTPEYNAGPLITIIIWCINTLMMVAIMCFVCERLRFSRNNTKILVNEVIMDYDLPKTMRVQAKTFMELIEAWPLSIFIYDMFSVDITLMLKFISVSTTYLIVIIQVSHFV